MKSIDVVELNYFTDVDWKKNCKIYKIIKNVKKLLLETGQGFKLVLISCSESLASHRARSGFGGREAVGQ